MNRCRVSFYFTKRRWCLVFASPPFAWSRDHLHPKQVGHGPGLARLSEPLLLASGLGMWKLFITGPRGCTRVRVCSHGELGGPTPRTAGGLQREV